MLYCTCTPGEEIQLDGDDHGDDDDDDDERDDDDECFVESDDADALRRRMGGYSRTTGWSPSRWLVRPLGRIHLLETCEPRQRTRDLREPQGPRDIFLRRRAAGPNSEDARSVKVVPAKRDLPAVDMQSDYLPLGHRDWTVQTRVQTFNHSFIPSFIRSFNLFLPVCRGI